MAESQQTLARMLIVKKFPQDQERKKALQLRCHRENRLRLGYQSRRADLLRLLSPAMSEQNGEDAKEHRQINGGSAAHR